MLIEELEERIRGHIDREHREVDDGIRARHLGDAVPSVDAISADWLTEAGCTHVAMESTGVYWKPLYNLLEDQFTLLLVNAQHIKTVPGRKTDVKDCEWIADLLRHGLLKASFVPDRPQRELRELTRYRTSLIQERSAEINRLQKTLEGANIKLASVATDIMGKSGRAILAALVAGTTDPVVLADLAKERLRQKLSQLQKALDGRIGQPDWPMAGRARPEASDAAAADLMRRRRLIIRSSP